jgi:peptidoglycan/xylan/chitin deacetylase (PgdA/CDA1 family)
MKFYTIKTPSIVQRIFSQYTWRFSSVPKDIYLTFDDGPTPEVTEFVLDQLKKFNAKATFFCIGKNVKNHPEIYQSILTKGHSVGNHTFNHVNGFFTKNQDYLNNVEKAAECIESNLFRPPYGKLTSSQGKGLQKKGYKIVMWGVLSADFDTKITPEKCLENVVKNASNGSIVVMHDSIKAKEKIYYSLPKILAHFTERGFKFKAIP